MCPSSSVYPCLSNLKQLEFYVLLDPVVTATMDEDCVGEHPIHPSSSVFSRTTARGESEEDDDQPLTPPSVPVPAGSARQFRGVADLQPFKATPRDRSPLLAVSFLLNSVDRVLGMLEKVGAEMDRSSQDHSSLDNPEVCSSFSPLIRCMDYD